MKSSIKFMVVLLTVAFFAPELIAQTSTTDPVTYEELYDDPESIKKLFIAFQPIYGELWAANPNVGFGVDALYFLKDKADFRVHMRKSYATMFDTYRQSAIFNSDMDNEPFVLNHFEFGGSYHFKDDIGDSETRMVLYKRNYRGSRWAAQVPTTIVVPSKLRKIYGARLGGLIFDTTTDLNRVMSRQSLTHSALVNLDGVGMNEFYLDELGVEKQVNVFGNILNMGVYTGVSMTWIRNVAVDIDNHEPGLDDHILTAYIDLLITPWMNVENVFYQDVEYSVAALETSPIGFRMGIEGRNNRTLSWGYGGEIGVKPGYKKTGFFALLKISIPVFGTDLNYDAEAFAK